MGAGTSAGAVKRWRELGEGEGAEMNRRVEKNRQFGFRPLLSISTGKKTPRNFREGGRRGPDLPVPVLDECVT